MVVLGLILVGVGPTLLLWCVLGYVSSTGAQMYMGGCGFVSDEAVRGG